MTEKMEFISLGDLTHKQLADVVTHMTGVGMKAEFTNPEPMRDWARYYAEFKMSKALPTVFRASLKIKEKEVEKKKVGERRPKKSAAPPAVPVL